MSRGPSIKVKYWRYDDLRNVAQAFLERAHPGGEIPVPIEEIIELRYKLDIVPTPGLKPAFDIDGFISSDLSTIYVDEFVYESYLARYRFTLAHELAQQFQVSSQTIQKRIEHDNLWPENRNSYDLELVPPAKVPAGRIERVVDVWPLESNRCHFRSHRTPWLKVDANRPHRYRKLRSARSSIG